MATDTSMHSNDGHVPHSGLALAELSHAFFHPDSLEDTLLGVTAACTQLLPAAIGTDVLIISGKKFQSHAATNDLPVRLDELQEEYGEGPCIDAALDTLVVRSNNLSADERWPRFSEAATDLGIHSVLSFKLYTSNEGVGALNIFGGRGGFSSQDEEVGLMLAANAAMALYTVNKTQQFTSALASRDLIGQAKGMIMERYRLGSVQAFQLLSKYSQNENIPVHALAQRIVDAGPEARI
ncbi:GAF and ANTAR domain-containing protein [Rhodococcus sp. G-MC3]|uniref:GAF and ANTAR domain-containing protein n=1 Tax=Rhodococcus sp. G-MC3 TaxID=3046209 RepID=UPI0024B8F99C|nr:GAF and ANTAR domain-containing protein [Rhodococcus sp. G-MC3]MDJ0396470.1 GAF and ANTAR domain-containing protein [Rhodococcus sp. G-MC3]